MADGFTGANGLKGSRVVTGSGSLLPLRQDTRARGPAVCRMVTVPRPMPTAVSPSPFDAFTINVTFLPLNYRIQNALEINERQIAAPEAENVLFL